MLLLGLGAVGGEGAALAKISATGTFKIEKTCLHSQILSSGSPINVKEELLFLLSTF